MHKEWPPWCRLRAWEVLRSYPKDDLHPAPLIILIYMLERMNFLVFLLHLCSYMCEGRMKWVWADILLHRTSVFKDSRDFLVAYRWYSRLYYTIGHQHGGPRCERLSLSRHCLFFAFGKRPSWPARKLGISFWVNVADCCKWALGHGDCRAGERRVSFEL
jgi:hypothetical protein